MTTDGYTELRIMAEVFEDVQKERIATQNRAERGGIDPEFLAPTLARLEAAERYSPSTTASRSAACTPARSYRSPRRAR